MQNGAVPEGEGTPTQAGVKEVIENVEGTLTKLQAQFPPDGVLVMNISAAFLQSMLLYILT